MRDALSQAVQHQVDGLWHFLKRNISCRKSERVYSCRWRATHEISTEFGTGMDVTKFLENVRRHPLYAGQITHVEALPPRAGQYAQPSSPLPDQLTQMLARRGIERLYSHQVAALEAARASQDLVVVTGTASGKTLCYNLPIFESCLANAEARALYLFPTKALAQDQLKGLLELIHGSDDEATTSRQEGSVNLRPGVYDGDTPTAQRRRIRAEANLVLTNPDMLHASLLPYHPKWARVLSELKYVVVDEVHTYRGILGANVACVLRRLQRVCAHYGANPVFLSASATIANPGELTSRLIGRDVEVIDNDGAPRGKKHFVLWNPTPLGKDQLARRSATDDAVWLMADALEDGAQALAFTRTRQAAELIHRYVQDDLRERKSPLADSVRAYRGGYLPNERRQIEQDLFSGNLRGVAATNALEMGVDIGSLDAAILVNYPGTIASCWQQAGRSGRRNDESLAVLVAGNDPIDQFLLRHPGYFFAQSPEHAVVDPHNPYVLANHLRAAAFELPLDEDTPARFGEAAPAVAEVLCEEDELSRIDGRMYYAGGQNPAHGVSLRHMSDNTFSIVLLRDLSEGSPLRDVVHAGRGNPRSSDQFGRIAAKESRRVRPRVGNASQAASRRRRSETEDVFEVIANVDAISAPELVYPEAIYLHNGETYFVRELDLDGKVAYVERRETDYYTQAVLESDVRIQRTLIDDSNTATSSHDMDLNFGEVDVSWQTVMFKKIKFDTRENVGYGPVDIPAQSLPTTAFWLSPAEEVRVGLKSEGLRMGEGLCGLRNLAVVALPMVAMCDSRDISGVVDSKNLGRTTMILYDRYPGGLGYCEKGFHNISGLLDLCFEMVGQCPCADGCPSCVGLPNLRPAIHSDPDLMRGYPIPNKQATVRLLELLTAAK